MAVEFELVARAGDVLHPNAAQVPRLATPLPTGLHHDVAAEIHVLPQVAVDRHEGAAPQVPHRPHGTVLHPKLEGPGPAPAVVVPGPFDLAVDAEVFGEEVGVAPDQGVAAVVDPRIAGVFEEEFVAQVALR